MFDSVCELFGETIRNVFVGVVAILLLNVMDVFSVCGGALLIECQPTLLCSACDPNERLSAPSICFVCVFGCRISSSSITTYTLWTTFKSLRAGSRVFALIMLFL